MQVDRLEVDTVRELVDVSGKRVLEMGVVSGQLFAAALSRAKGLDADQPVGLTKVTLAQ